ncbi:MAG TPA: hypothetical protein VH352_27520 [Pseudonocardiaceae bacterium]|jgi:Mce-associated membrane protein|nr:hypothetical protein [Pseudonocardiaceae bacterium]
MPPTPRRRPIPAPTPVRRPKVAGLRHPEAPASAEPAAAEPTPAEVTDVIPVIPAEPVTQASRKPKPSGKPKPRHEWSTATWTEPDEPTKPRRARAKAEPETTEFPAFTESLAPIEATDSRPRRTLVLPIALAVAAVLIGGLASFFAVQWNHARGTVQNTALVDAAGTSEVSGQVVSAVNQVFSYNYTNMKKTQDAVQQVLTGSALCQYNLLYKVVQQQAPSQKLVLTTTVQAKGVEMLQGAAARVLLLVQQTDTRASTNQTSTSQSMIAVNAVKQGGKWKISNIDTFNGANTTPGC